MKMKYYFLSLLIAAFALQATSQSAAQRDKLLEMAAQFKIKSQTEKAEAVRVATEKGWPIRTEDADGGITELMRLDENGMPMYYTTYNAEGAAVINSDELYPGGAAGLNLSGAGQTLGEWDGGGVLTTHDEFFTVASRVTQKDNPASLHWHSTHVAGTMIASGAFATAKGMSYGANLSAYDWNNDEAEMALEAAGGMKVSQHSYGQITGWYKNGADWYWYGNTSISETEDSNWGFYDSYASDWDVIAHNAPNYVIVKSAGNDRGEGPTSGAFHYYWNGAAWIGSNTARDLDGGATGYDCIGHRGVGKNIITVGAVTAGGVMSSFSGWGPTDDGRIKPDIVAKGVSVLSSHSAGVDQYSYSNGTSMSGPMVSGSIGLLLEHQENLHPGVPLRSASIKGLIIHTGSDLGNTGPDYAYGWGMMDTEAAAAIMTDQAASPVHIYENTLNDLQSLSMPLKAKGGEPLKATIVWNDVPGTPVAPALDPTDLMLVNDLDMRITSANATVTFPYILDPGNPATAATTGDNFRDNVEVIYIASPTAGEIYDLQITHKNNLSGGSQDYTLIVTGNEAFDYTYLFNAADNAGNYGGSWIDGSNQGNGFDVWSLTAGTNGGFSGHFVGDPSGAGITGMPNPSFGLYANPGDNGNFANADRPLTGPLSIGSTLSFMWGVNWDSNGGGNKGINLYVGGTSGTQIININMGASAAITINGNTMFDDYGTNAMTLNFEYVSAGQLRVYATGRDGVETYDQTIAVAGAPDAIRFYASGLDSGGERQPYFNNFTITTNFNSTPSNSDAVAVGDLTFDADLVLDNLTIESGNSVTVAPLKKLTVNTNIDNQAGTSAFVLQSDASGTASLLHNNNDVPATIQRHINGGGYHFVSVPISGSLTAGLFMHAYLYYFDADADPQAWASVGDDPLTVITNNQGYMIWYTGSNTTYEFTGDLINGNFPVATPAAASVFNDPYYIGGYNLVPNPYPSSIDWNASSGFTESNLFETIWIYNRTAGNYGAYVRDAGSGTNDVSNIIPVGQSFFVQATTAGAGSMTINQAARTHSANDLLKDGNLPVELLKVKVSANNYSDELIVQFNEEASLSFEGNRDAQKLRSFGDSPQFYSLTPEGTELSINSIPYSTETYMMELGFEWNQSGEATIEIQGMESFGDWVSIVFEDRLTGITFDLRDQNSYSFQHEAEADPSRFMLHFMGVTDVDELQTSKTDYHIWSADKQLHISNPAALPALLEVFDVQGRLIYSASQQSDAKWTISGLPEAQLLMIRVRNAETVVNQKIFIR